MKVCRWLVSQTEPDYSPFDRVRKNIDRLHDSNKVSYKVDPDTSVCYCGVGVTRWFKYDRDKL
jgi:hypothetical protein